MAEFVRRFHFRISGGVLERVIVEAWTAANLTRWLEEIDYSQSWLFTKLYNLQNATKHEHNNYPVPRTRSWWNLIASLVLKQKGLLKFPIWQFHSFRFLNKLGFFDKRVDEP